MAAVTNLGSTVDTNTGNRTVVATPAVGDLIVAICCSTGRTTAQAPTLSDNNGSPAATYTQVQANTKNTSADSIWIFVRSELIRSASSTTFTMTQSSDTGGGINIFKITGCWQAGLAAARKVGGQSNQAGSTTPAVTWTGGGSSVAGNPILGAVFNGTNPATLTQPTGYTEAVDTGYATPTTGYESVFLANPSATSTVTWGSATTVYASVAVEIDVSIQPDSSRFRELNTSELEYGAMQAVARGAFR